MNNAKSETITVPAKYRPEKYIGNLLSVDMDKNRELDDAGKRGEENGRFGKLAKAVLEWLKEKETENVSR